MHDRKIIDLETKERALQELRRLAHHEPQPLRDALGLSGCLAWATVQRMAGATLRERVDAAIKHLGG